MNALRSFALLSMWLLVSFAHAQEPAKKKPLAVEDLYLMESVKSPALFPKEEKLVYERVWIDAKTKTERHSLWLVTDNRENRKPLQKGEPDGRSPVVSPDGKWIAFLSTQPSRLDSSNAYKKGKLGDLLPPKALPLSDPPLPASSDPAVDIWLYNVEFGFASPLGSVILPAEERRWGRVFHDGFYGRVAFSADSKKLVFVADDGIDPRTKEEKENDVEIVRPDQGEGYTGYGPAQIWVAQVAFEANDRKFTRLTNDDIWYGDPQWSPDGKSLVVVANKSKDRESVRFSINKNFDLYLIDVASKKQTQLTTNPGPDVSPRWSPDGKQIAYLSSPRNGPHRDVLGVGIVRLGEGEPKARILVNQTGSEKIFPSPFPLPQGCWEGKDVLRVRDETGGWPDIFEYYIDVTREKGVTPTADLQTKQQERQAPLMPETNKFLEGRFTDSGTSELIRWKNKEFEIDGVLTCPAPEVAKPPFKLIVYPHGGPHGRSSGGMFDFTVQLFAAQGYAVFQPNFRGSTGYGKKFLDADRFDLGGGDMRDILTGIDKLVKVGKVDPQRQFVYGISYGGFMASWLVGHTHQFRAAVAQNAVTDMNMMYGLSDIQSWTTWELGGAPWEQPERYKKHSPLTHANKIKTPTLILHARDDRRCPLPMGKAFHQALLANDVPTQMVIYPNEGHGIRSPRHREDVYRRVLAWFAKHDVK